MVSEARQQVRTQLLTALSLANQCREHPSIRGDYLKLRELVDVIEAIQAALASLDTGRDEHGRPVSARQAAERLRHMGHCPLSGMVFFRLDIDAPPETREFLDALQQELRQAAEAMVA